ncbi:MAG: hypothetical protein MJZ13_01170 [Bacteroidales bacterium]|nr:hypothetical protein [Bacteroidales bacterium]
MEVVTFIPRGADVYCHGFFSRCLLFKVYFPYMIALSIYNCFFCRFGTASYDTYVGGSGSGNVNRMYKVSVCEGIKNAGYSVEPTIESGYLNHIAEEKAKTAAENFWTIPTFSEMSLKKADVEKAMSSVDVALMTIGRMAGEAANVSDVRESATVSIK